MCLGKATLCQAKFFAVHTDTHILRHEFQEEVIVTLRTSYLITTRELEADVEFMLKMRREELVTKTSEQKKVNN